MSEMIVANANNTISTFEQNKENAKLVFNATSNSDSLKDYTGKVITLKGAFLTDGFRRSRDGGDDIPCVNTYIIDANNKSYFSQSMGVARDMRNLIHLYGGDVEGLKIRIGERSLADGRTIKYVELV